MWILKWKCVGGANLHQLHVHWHVDGEEHVDGVRVPQDQGILQRETWTGISGQCQTLPIFENSWCDADVSVSQVSAAFTCFNTLGGGHALGCKGRDDWWAHDDGKDFRSIEQCSGVSPYLILICTRLFVWMNCEAVRSTPWGLTSSTLEGRNTATDQYRLRLTRRNCPS